MRLQQFKSTVLDEEPTLLVVRYSVPVLLDIEKGSLPGYLFRLCNVKAVRGGDVHSLCSCGSGVNASAESITQLLILGVSTCNPTVNDSVRILNGHYSFRLFIQSLGVQVLRESSRCI